MNLDDLEKKVDQITTDLEKKIDQLGKSLEERIAGAPPAQSASKPEERGKTPLWGLALVVVGLVLLANHFEWFHLDLPMIPALLIIIGLFLVLDNR